MSYESLAVPSFLVASHELRGDFSAFGDAIERVIHNLDTEMDTEYVDKEKALTSRDQLSSTTKMKSDRSLFPTHRGM